MGAQGRIVWHDLMTTDLDGSKRFYGELFNWRFAEQGEWCFLHVGNEEAHFGTVMKMDKAQGIPTHWVPYLTVKDLDAAAAAVTKHGGKIHLPKHPAGETGVFSVVSDPQGATFTLWQYTGGQAKPEVDTPPGPGHFCWDELLTSDPDAAIKFYGSVIGYGTEHMEMGGEMGRYTLWLRDEKRPDGKPRQAGGMMKKPPMVPRPFWLSYVAVGDCDATVEKAKRLGATPTSPPMNIPNVGRFATLLDAQMAPFAVLGPNR